MVYNILKKMSLTLGAQYNFWFCIIYCTDRIKTTLLNIGKLFVEKKLLLLMKNYWQIKW